MAGEENEKAREYQKRKRRTLRLEGAEDFVFWLRQKNYIDDNTHETFLEYMKGWKKDENRRL